MLDCLIKGGTVVDGTGRPGVRAEVGIRDGRIIVVGETDEPAARTIDATGLVVSPGFIDLHTHFDAQIMWDPLATPSCLHGVTTVIGGNCGFGVAPLAEDAADYVCRMLAIVEGMPLPALQQGLSWDWGSFGDWLGRLDDRVGVNVGFLVGHSVLRRVVMGDAVGSAADAGQVDQMVQLLHESLAAGGLGFSSSWAPTHVDGDGNPVPSRAATADELLALAGAVGEHPGTTLAFIPGVQPFAEHEIDAMIGMSRVANRPLNWNVFRVGDSDAALVESRLTATSQGNGQGAHVVGLAFPGPAEFIFSFANAIPLSALSGWSATMALDVEGRMKALRDPDTRRVLEQEAAKGAGRYYFARWAELSVAEVFSEENQELVGRVGPRIADIAAQTGRSAFDTVVDITLADDLQTAFAIPPQGDDPATWKLRSEYWGDPRTVIGGSDAGAHLESLCGSQFTTDFVGSSVRERKLISLERAIQLITDQPARLLGLTGRGRIAEGYWADLVLFQPDVVRPGPLHTRRDLPGGASRLYSEPLGVERVLVNGVDIVADNVLTGDLPGVVLRSGRDLSTVTAV